MSISISLRFGFDTKSEMQIENNTTLLLGRGNFGVPRGIAFVSREQAELKLAGDNTLSFKTVLYS